MYNLKTLIMILLGIGVLVIAGYSIFPSSRAGIAVVAPYLLLALPMVLCCFMMMGMYSSRPKDKQTDKDRK